ncbi:hypothetical protein EU408_06705 [Salmonella enterica subsp. enterica]|nr:hypothetical protein [Salmonella enterica subsp. enterica]EJN2862401.1 hypothetical protein [Salmonella enterica subsp. enterica serovar Yaba]
MKIYYEDFGSIARITLRAVLPELRRYNQAIDAAQIAADVAVTRTGIIFMTATITGKTPAVMKAYKSLCREAAK